MIRKLLKLKIVIIGNDFQGQIKMLNPYLTRFEGKGNEFGRRGKCGWNLNGN